MSDTIAVLQSQDGSCALGFLFKDRWDRVYARKRDKVRTWGTPDQALAFLRRVAGAYKTEYGEDLPWDVDAIPVLGCNG